MPADPASRPQSRRSIDDTTVYALPVGFEWFPSFDAVPGVRWQPLVPIDRAKLRGLDARPRAERRPLDEGRSYLHVEWLAPTGDELSNELASPAVLRQRKMDGEPDPAPQTIAEAISEMLAVPGTRGDYHFGMLSAWGALYRVRRLDHRTFHWIEALCLADITLMEQGAELVFAEDHWRDQEGVYPIVPAFDRLSSLYQREGFLAAAVEIEKRCAALGASRLAGDEAIARQVALLEEDGR